MAHDSGNPPGRNDVEVKVEGRMDELEVQAYSIREFSRIYAISESTTQRLIKAGTIVTVQAGGRKLIVAESARTWFAALPCGKLLK